MKRKNHSIQSHEGILEVVPEQGDERVSIAFGPKRLDEAVEMFNRWCRGRWVRPWG